MATTLTFRLLKRLGLVNNEAKYGNTGPIKIARRFCRIIIQGICFKLSYPPAIFSTFWQYKVRARLWKIIGCRVGRDVKIGHSVSLDLGNADKIILEDEVWITNGCTILCHKRDLSGYYAGDRLMDQPYILKPVVLKRGCQIGMEAMIMPGVTIGEGAIIGARSVVTKDIPAWTVATGVPCKVVRHLPRRQDKTENL